VFGIGFQMLTSMVAVRANFSTLR